jgi:hypothetical protein
MPSADLALVRGYCSENRTCELQADNGEIGKVCGSDLHLKYLIRGSWIVVSIHPEIWLPPAVLQHEVLPSYRNGRGGFRAIVGTEIGFRGMMVEFSKRFFR